MRLDRVLLLSGSAHLEGEHGRGVVVEALGQLLIGPVLGLAASGCPHTPHVMARIAQHVLHIVPVVHPVGDHLPLLERQRLGHLAVLHLPSGVVVADALLRIVVEGDADIAAAVGHDHAGLTVGDHAAANLSRYGVVAAHIAQLKLLMDGPQWPRAGWWRTCDVCSSIPPL